MPADTLQAWMAHDDANHVVTLYDPKNDGPSREEKEVAALIRRGLWVRRILDAELAAKSWDRTLTEKKLLKVAEPPLYDFDEGNAKQIAAKLVRLRRGEE